MKNKVSNHNKRALISAIAAVAVVITVILLVLVCGNGSGSYSVGGEARTQLENGAVPDGDSHEAGKDAADDETEAARKTVSSEETGTDNEQSDSTDMPETTAAEILDSETAAATAETAASAASVPETSTAGATASAASESETASIAETAADHEHNYVYLYTIKETLDCMNPGVYVNQCTICGAQIEKSYKMEDASHVHNFSNCIETFQETTCTEQGMYLYECTALKYETATSQVACDATKTMIVDAAHKWVEKQEEVAVTLVEKNWYVCTTCRECFETYEEFIQHSMEMKEQGALEGEHDDCNYTTENSYLYDTVTFHVCSVCGEYKETFVYAYKGFTDEYVYSEESLAEREDFVKYVENGIPITRYEYDDTRDPKS